MICPRCSGHGFVLTRWLPPTYEWCRGCRASGLASSEHVGQRFRAMWAAAVAGAVAVSACNTPAANFPPPTDDQTCGVNEQQCTTLVNGEQVRNGYCCPETTACGNPQLNWSCPTDSCCATGQGDGVGQYGVRAPVKQKLER